MGPRKKDEAELLAEARSFVHTKAYMLFRDLMGNEALEGDESFMKAVLRALLAKILNGQALDGFEQNFLLIALGRGMADPTCLRVMAGSAGKTGRGRRGESSFTRALHVLTAVVEKDQSVESAWEAVAQQENVSVSMVQKDWAKWRAKIMRAGGLSETTNAAELR